MSDFSRLSGAARWGRATITSTVIVALALVAHVSGGGLLPGPVWLIGFAGLTCAVSVRLLARPASWVRIVTLVVVGQTAAHLFLAATAGHRGQPGSGTAAGLELAQRMGKSPPGFSDGGPRTGSLRDLTTGTPTLGADGSAHVAIPSLLTHLPDELSGPNAAMAVAHLVAAGAIGVWLAAGERALWTLVALIGPAAGRIRSQVASSTTILTVMSACASDTDAHSRLRLAALLPMVGLFTSRTAGRSQQRTGPPAFA